MDSKGLSNTFDETVRLNEYLHREVNLYRLLISVLGVGFVLMSIFYATQPDIICS